MAHPTRQEIAYQEIGATFLTLIQRDPLIDPEMRKTVVAWWVDLFDHPGVANNMKLAISNLLAQQDKRVDAARKAGIQSVRDAIEMQYNSAKLLYPSVDIPLEEINGVIDALLFAEESTEEVIDAAEMDLSEVGGNDEDNTPIPL